MLASLKINYLAVMNARFFILMLVLLAVGFSACKTKQAKKEAPTAVAPSVPSIGLRKCPLISRGTAAHKDPLASLDASIQGDCIALKMSYSGGCAEHHIDLYWSGDWMKTKPAVVKLYVSHNSNEDMCEAIKSEVKEFDLTELRSNLGGQVIVEVYGEGVPMKRVNYTY